LARFNNLDPADTVWQDTFAVHNCIMKQTFVVLLSFLLTGYVVSAQTPTDSTKKAKKDWSKVKLNNRANDHFMVQLGYDGWAGKPDSIRTKGFGHSINVYLMMDFPFKSDPRMSVGLGLGVGTSSIYFDQQEPKITAQTSTLPFTDYSGTNAPNHFKKMKLATNFIELPIELRFVSNPERSDNSFKVALGVKGGLLVDAHTKGKTLVNASGATVNDYTQKEKSKAYFNSTRISGTLRVGYGHFTVFGQYSLSNVLKEGRGPSLHTYSIGLTLSGL